MPQIEGLIWDFSFYLDKYEVNIYNEEQKLEIVDTGKPPKKLTIGNLLSKNEMKEYFDDNFIKYFCDELYNERNPILHGNEMQLFSKLNAAKKIATLEYLLAMISSHIKSEIFTQLRDNVPQKIIDDSVKAVKEFVKSNIHQLEEKNDELH